MKRTLFTGTEGLWYRDRLKHMFRRKPKCALLYQMNHLVGTCPTCGMGSYATSKRWKIQYMTVNRLYPILCATRTDMAPHAPFASSLCQHLYSNTEFPLPIIKYHTFVHVPAFLDAVNKRVIDFLPKTKNGAAVIRETNKVLAAAGYGYHVFCGETQIFKSKQPDVDDATIRLAMALRSFVQPGGDVPWN